MPHLLDRRRFLQLVAASAASASLSRRAWAQFRFSSDPFSLGIASGSPTHDSIVLWTRLAPAGPFASDLGKRPVTVRWDIAHDDRFEHIVQSGQAVALAELGHAVHVEVNGLASDRWYFYRFIVGDARSDTGRTRTFPAPDADAARLRIAYASCQRWEHGYFSAYRHMRDESLDAVLFLGDYVYEYPNARAAVRPLPGGWTISLDDYRQRYALHRSDPDLQAMHAVCPWLVTWDDHEVQNDYAGDVAGNSGPAAGNFPARRAAAYQAYYEHMPLRASVLTRALNGLASGAEMRIYSEVRFGTLASFYLVDDRQYRDRQACTRNGRLGSSTVEPATCASWSDPKRTLLGEAQERWLDDAFERAGKGWNILALQTLFGQRDLQTGGGPLLWNDGWDGYPAARDRITASMRKRSLTNPVLLGGDLHENWVGHVKAEYADPRSQAIGVEFCGTSITARSDDGGRTQERLARNPHFIFANSTRKGYGVAEFTPRQLTTSLRVVDDVTKQVTAIETLAKFSVAAGRPVIERV